MPKPALIVLASLAVSLPLLALTGCGADSASVVHIDGTSALISKATLNHWMRAMAGGDFRSDVGTTGPQGLVSEPANYSECASAARAIVPKTATGQPKLSAPQIAAKCQQLHRSIRAQALSFLISVQWAIAEGAEDGLKVADAQLQREFARYRRSQYPTERDLHTYMAERRWVLSDILYQLKRNILVTEILPIFERRVTKAGGGEHVYAELALERHSAWTARTNCRAGYVVPGCKQYSGPPSVLPSPDVILSEFVAGT